MKLQKQEICVQIERIIIELNENYRRLNINIEPLNRKIAFDIYSNLIDLAFNFQEKVINEKILIEKLKKIQFTLNIIGSQLPILDKLIKELNENT